MRLLLDTHIWLWSLLEPERLGRETSGLLADPQHEIWLSPISVWEALVLAERKRIALEPDPIAWVRAQLARLPFHAADLNTEIAIESRNVAVSHADPADRFLVATARVYDLTLVTADTRLQRIPGVSILPNA